MDVPTERQQFQVPKQWARRRKPRCDEDRQELLLRPQPHTEHDSWFEARNKHHQQQKQHQQQQQQQKSQHPATQMQPDQQQPQQPQQQQQQQQPQYCAEDSSMQQQQPVLQAQCFETVAEHEYHWQGDDQLNHQRFDEQEDSLHEQQQQQQQQRQQQYLQQQQQQLQLQQVPHFCQQSEPVFAHMPPQESPPLPCWDMQQQIPTMIGGHHLAQQQQQQDGEEQPPINSGVLFQQQYPQQDFVGTNEGLQLHQEQHPFHQQHFQTMSQDWPPFWQGQGQASPYYFCQQQQQQQQLCPSLLPMQQQQHPAAQPQAPAEWLDQPLQQPQSYVHHPSQPFCPMPAMGVRTEMDGLNHPFCHGFRDSGFTPMSTYWQTHTHTQQQQQQNSHTQLPQHTQQTQQSQLSMSLQPRQADFSAPSTFGNDSSALRRQQRRGGQSSHCGALGPVECIPIENNVEFHRFHEFTARIGKGGFARVYAARRLSEDQSTVLDEVAVKVTDLRGPDGNSLGVEQLRRYKATQREVYVLQRVCGQERCVTFKGSATEGFFSYIVMERCQLSLLQALESLPDYTEFTLKQVLTEMLHALVGIHTASVVHRDIKPDNFLCAKVEGGKMLVKLCDFGLADVITSRKPELKDVYGTAPFMSPEMLAGKGYGVPTDMWSFGVLAYVMMLGHFPYRALDKTSKGMKSAILHGIPEPTFRPKVQSSRTYNCGISPGAICFLQRVMNRDPEARPDAERALNIAWLRMSSEEDRASATSLKPMFESAKHAGAFTVGGGNTTEVCSIEAELTALQAKYHKKDGFLVPMKRSDTESTQVGSASAGNSPRSEQTREEANKGASPLEATWITQECVGQMLWT